ncbi:hypothetical protein [Runella zeae]|uniref:hypothetical protein n=1 Tax=Runella zeae TaxID=94255 RepID=UPI00040D9EDE|nr:hypothetical protein [Runella zeae]
MLVDFIESQNRVLPGARVGDRSPRTKGAYIAMAYFNSGALGGIGASYTMGANTEVTITEKNLPDVLVDLAFKGGAFCFFNPSISGSKDKANRIKLPELMGTQAVAEESGEVTERFMIKVRDYYKNVEHFNALAYKSGEMDVILFTNNGFQWLKAREHQPVFTDMSYAIQGDANQPISAGDFAINTSSAGEIPIKFGIVLSKLAASRLKFTWAAVGSLVNLTAQPCESGGLSVFSRTASATACTLPRAVNETATCIQYSIKQLNINDAGTNDVSQYVTIGSTTGIITLASALTAGIFDFIVVAETPNGIWGSWEFRIKAS